MRANSFAPAIVPEKAWPHQRHFWGIVAEAGTH
jgi:hypothetical protein